MRINQFLILRLSSLLTRPYFLAVFVWYPDYCSDEEGLPGSLCVSPPSVAMASSYFPTFLLLLFLSSFTLLLVTFLPSVALSNPFSSSSLSSSWPSPSCGPGQSWAVRLHTGPHCKHDDDDEHSSVHLDVIANQVQYFIKAFSDRSHSICVVQSVNTCNFILILFILFISVCLPNTTV